MEPPVRIELTTYALQVRCSTTELGRPLLTLLQGWHLWQEIGKFRNQDRAGLKEPVDCAHATWCFGSRIKHHPLTGS